MNCLESPVDQTSGKEREETDKKEKNRFRKSLHPIVELLKLPCYTQENRSLPLSLYLFVPRRRTDGYSYRPCTEVNSDETTTRVAGRHVVGVRNDS